MLIYKISYDGWYVVDWKSDFYVKCDAGSEFRDIELWILIQMKYNFIHRALKKKKIVFALSRSIGPYYQAVQPGVGTIGGGGVIHSVAGTLAHIYQQWGTLVRKRKPECKSIFGREFETAFSGIYIRPTIIPYSPHWPRYLLYVQIFTPHTVSNRTRPSRHIEVVFIGLQKSYDLARCRECFFFVSADSRARRQMSKKRIDLTFDCYVRIKFQYS